MSHFFPVLANYQPNLLASLSLCFFIVSSHTETYPNNGSTLSQMCSIGGHHGRMAGYCLSNSKWISGSLRWYPFHYNAGLCYSSFQTSNCPVLLTFIDIPDFKWKHNTEVRRRFWDSRDPRWGQGRKLLQNFQMPNMLGWGEEQREKNKTQRWGRAYSQPQRYGCLIATLTYPHIQGLEHG